MMKILARAFISFILVLAGIHSLVWATQETVIQNEARKFGERAIRQGFQCRTEIHQTTGKSFEIKLSMNKNILYYMAVVTGRGEKTAHARSATLINQENKVISLELQNTLFGSELKIHPLVTGEKTLKFDLDAKSNYSLVVCTNYASLFHTGEKAPVVDDHTHF